LELKKFLIGKGVPLKAAHLLNYLDFCRIWLFKEIAVALSRKEIAENWEWLERNVLPILSTFESEDDIHQYVKTKIESLLVQVPADDVAGIVE
jgi:hypothetical protein